MDSKKLSEIGLLLMGPTKEEKKPESPDKEGEMDSMEQVAVDAMQAFLDAAKGGDAEQALMHCRHLLRVVPELEDSCPHCGKPMSECEDGNEYAEE